MTETETEAGRRPPRGGPGPEGRGISVLQTIVSGWARAKEASILVVTIVLFLYFSAIVPLSFNSVDNYGVIANYVAPVAIIAAGEVMVLICGEIDLSSGMVFALAPFIMYLLHQSGLPLGLAVVLALACSLVIGIVNGGVTVKLRIPSFITTLGMLFLLNGITLTISSGHPVGAPTEGLAVRILGGWEWAEILWALGIVAVMAIVLSGTRFGIHTVATGGNLLGAAESGVKVDFVKISAFAMTSVFAGFAGILDGIRITSLNPLAGGTLTMFYAVAAAVIGGTALVGGTGTVIGALIGAVFLGILKDGLHLVGVSAFTYDIVLGAAILVAMLLNVSLIYLRGRRRR
ncbi:MAG: ABC transporter permease [Streptosporangiaceae bacterium]